MPSPHTGRKVRAPETGFWEITSRAPWQVAKPLNYSGGLRRELRSTEVRLLSLKGSDSFIEVVADMFPGAGEKLTRRSYSGLTCHPSAAAKPRF